MKRVICLFCFLSLFLISCTQVTNEEEPEILSSIEITSFPKKMVYNKGEYFSSEGLGVRAVFSNGVFQENFTVTISPASGSRLMEVGKTEITVSAGGLKRSFSVQVNEATRSSIKITKSPEKTIYISGETFDSTGIEVSEILTDDTTKLLSAEEYTINPSDGTEFTEIKKVKLQVSVPGFSDSIALQVYGETEEDPENPNQYLYYSIEDNEITITGLAKNCTAHDIVIPEKLGDYPVTKIQSLSPYYYDQVTSSPMITLKIPASVKSISDEALYNISSLEKIEFAEGLETIGKAAFKNCYALKELKFPESLTFIGTDAFDGCTALSSVEIPNEECIISELAFIGCPIKNLSVANMNDVYASDGLKLSDSGIFSGAEPITVTYTGTKPRIGTRFFDGACVEKIVYPEGRENVLTTVGTLAFNEATVYEKLLPEGIKTIEDKAFAETNFYENRFVLPESIETIGSKVFCSDWWSYESDELEEFRFPASVKYIGKDSIPACKKLIFACNIADGALTTYKLDSRIKTIEIEEGVTSIGDYSLVCDEGVKLKLPSTIEKIWFSGNPVLINEKFDFPKLKDCIANFTAGNEAGEAVVYDMDYCNFEFLDEYGWNLVNVKGTIANESASICSKKVVVDDSITVLFGELNAQEIVLGKGITEIPKAYFSFCDNIRSVTINGQIKTIPKECFNGCESLSSITIPSSVETISFLAFGYCPSLKKVEIGEGVKTIEKSAFYGSGVKEITISSSVTEIGDYAFECTAFETLTLENLNEKLSFGDSVFANCENLKSVKIDTNCFGANYGSSGCGMFVNCKNLENITFTEKVTTIPDSAFLNCESLKEVTIPASVTRIVNGGGFKSCLSLKKVKYEGTTIPCEIGAAQILEEIIVKSGSDWESKFSDAIKNCINSGKIKLTIEQ